MSFLKSIDVSRAREKREEKKKKTNNMPHLGQLGQRYAKPGHAIFSASAVGCGSAQKGMADFSTERSHAEDKSEPSTTTKIEKYVRVDKGCRMSLIQNKGESTIIEIEFDDQSVLRIEIDKESVQNIHLANPKRGWSSKGTPNPSLAIISDFFARFIMDCKLAGVLSSANDSKQEIAFIGNDGIKLVMESSPGAVRRISYSE